MDPSFFANPQSGMGQLEAARGYAVLLPSLRAPHGGYNFTHDERYTEKARGAAGIPIMLDDFESAIASLAQQGIADPKRIGLFGHSNGGFLSNLLITRSSIPKCAVIAPGLSSVLEDFPYPPHVLVGFDFMTNANMNFIDDINDYVALSPMFKMRDVTASVLLILGDDDWLWVPQMINEFGALRALGKDVELVRYANEGHNFHQDGNIENVFTRENAFFDKCLKPEDSSRPD